MKYNLLFCINHAYTDILLVSLFSLIQESGFDETDVYIISRDLNEQDRRKIRILETEKIRITFIDFDAAMLEDAPVTQRYPAEIYFRLFACNLLPEDISKVLYIDVDTICINKLIDLYNTDINNVYFAACTHTRKLLTKINAIRLDVKNKTESVYINTGVMLMNLDLLRKHFDKKRIFAFLKENGRRLILPDQDLVMALYGDRILVLDKLIYNLSPRVFHLTCHVHSSGRMSVDFVKKNTAIIHFCGRKNPWKEAMPPLGIFWQEAEKRLKTYLDEKSR